jgi:hypothetical protein
MKLPVKHLGLAALLFIVALPEALVAGDDASQPDPTEATEKAQEQPVPELQVRRTKHQVRMDGRSIAYPRRTRPL